MSVSKDQLETIESQIRTEVKSAIAPMLQSIEYADKKYSKQVKETDSKYLRLVDSGNVTLKRSDSLINGIDRKIFNKKKRDVEVRDDGRSVISILDELSKLVNDFEGKGSKGLRNLTDSIMSKIDSEYKQDEIDRIVALHKILKLKIDNKQFENEKRNELLELKREHDQAVNKQRARISETIRKVVDKRMDSMVRALS